MSRLSESDLMNDSKYRQYASTVEKVLKTFESTNEWADLIAALTKLYKIIHNNSKFGEIPKNVGVSKRLSQCMHPALPFGVHLKAIECYKQIFDTLGTKNLSSDIHLYSVGLLPLLPNATINVKRALLELYENYFLPIGPDLKPALTGFLNGILPALEEGSEFFDRIINFVCQLESCVGSSYFFSCLWYCVINNSNCRSPGLFYASYSFEKKKNNTSNELWGLLDPDLTVRALIECCNPNYDQLSTNTNLIQRQLLDFLLQFLPLEHTVEFGAKNLQEEHYKLLIRSVSFVLLRRDQSLNRRFYAWLFGVTKENVDQSELIDQRHNYYEKFSHQLLIQSINELINQSTTNQQLIKICRLLTNFLDRQELKESICDELFLEFLSKMTTTLINEDVDNNKNNQDLIKALNLLASYQKQNFFWSFLAGKFSRILKDDVSKLEEVCGLIEFFLKFNNQMPHLTMDTSSLHQILYEIFNFSDSTIENFTILLKLSMKLMKIDQNINKDIQKFGLQFFGRLCNDLPREEMEFVEILCKFLSCLFNLSTVYNPANDELWLKNLQQLCKSDNLNQSVNFTQILLSTIIEKYPEQLYNERNFFFDLALLFWNRILCDFDLNLQPRDANLFKFQGNCAQILFILHTKFEFLERMIVEEMTSSDEVKSRRAISKFAHCWIFWRHLDENLASKPFEKWRNFFNCLNVFIELWDSPSLCQACMIMLTDYQDFLETNNNRQLLYAENSYLKSRWLENCMENGELLPKVLNFLMKKILDRKTWRFALDLSSSPQNFSCSQINGYSKLYKFQVKNQENRPNSQVYHFAGPSDNWSTVRNDHVFKLKDSDWSLDEEGDKISTNQMRPRSSASTISESDSVVRKVLNNVLQQVESQVQDENDDYAEEKSIIAPPMVNFDWSVEDQSVNAAFLYYYRFFDIDHVIFILRTLQRCFSKIDHVTMIHHTMSQTSLIEQLIRCQIDDVTQKFVDDQKISIFGKKSRDPDNFTFMESLQYSTCLFLRTLHLNNPMLDRPIESRDVESNLSLKMAASDLIGWIFRSMNLQLEKRRLRPDDVSKLKLALKKCKVQKTVLQCLKCTLQRKNDDYAGMIVDFNWALHSQPDLAKRTLQQNLLKISRQILKFEYLVKNELDHQNQFSTPVNQSSSSERCLVYEQDLILEEDNLDDEELEEDYCIVQCKLFRSIIDCCLQPRNFYAHVQFLNFVYSILQYAQDFLPYLIQCTMKRIRYNLELSFSQRLQNSQDPFPPDYGIELLKHLSLIGHFCLDSAPSSSSLTTPLETTNQNRAMSSFSQNTIVTSSASFSSSTNQNRPQNFLNTASSVILNPGDIFTNVFKAFNLAENSTNRSPNKKDDSSHLMNHHNFVMSRQQIFGQLSELLSTLCDIRSFLKVYTKMNNLGRKEDILQLIQTFVSPLALHYSRQFFWSMADVWASKSRKSKMSSLQENFYNIECKQEDVAEFLLSIECLTIEKIFDGASKILQHPLKSVTSMDKDTVPFELSLCELVYACSKNSRDKSSPLYNNKKCITWSTLQRFLQESLQSCQAPMSKLNLFKLFCDFVEEEKDDENHQIAGSKKMLYRKELQELCQQFLDCLLEIVSFQLAQPTWLKRTLILKESDHTSIMSSSSSFNELAAEIYDDRTTGGSLAVTDNNSLSASLSVLTTTTPAESSSTSGVLAGSGSSKRDVLSSVCALNLMADRLPNLIDSVYKSEDKEKLTFLSEKLWSNGVQPFLKSHSRKNAQNYLACSRLLAKLSQFPLIRNVWRKAALDLLCDQQFFNVDNSMAIESWLTIVDNLMSQDRNSFREFLSRTSLSQSSGLFTSKEQEYDSRFLSLKRLSFVLLSSEIDQYQQYLADIQERITDNLKLSSLSLNVYGQVLICLRVLLIRLSPHHFAPFWPTLVAELVNVLTLIEQDDRFAGLSKSATIQDQKSISRDEQSLNLYLCACKLLESLRCLPTEKMIQFQMYSWIFFPSVGKCQVNLSSSTYVDHSTQILNRFNIFCENPLYNDDQEQQLSSFLEQDVKNLSRFNDLKPFFRKLCCNNSNANIQMDKEAIVKLVEKSILVDLFDSFL